MKQLNLFSKSELPISSNHKRKYSMRHWSHRQRLIHRVSQSKSLTWNKMDLLAKDYPLIVKLIQQVNQTKSLTWKKMYLLAKDYPLIIKLMKKYRNDELGQNKIRPMKHPHSFPKTVNQKQLAKAVHAMYLRKHKHYALSINKICKKFKISKPSLYRGYNKKYKND